MVHHQERLCGGPETPWGKIQVRTTAVTLWCLAVQTQQLGITAGAEAALGEQVPMGNTWAATTPTDGCVEVVLRNWRLTEWIC